MKPAPNEMFRAASSQHGIAWATAGGNEGRRNVAEIITGPPQRACGSGEPAALRTVAEAHGCGLGDDPGGTDRAGPWWRPRPRWRWCPRRWRRRSRRAPVTALRTAPTAPPACDWWRRQPRQQRTAGSPLARPRDGRDEGQKRERHVNLLGCCVAVIACKLHGVDGLHCATQPLSAAARQACRGHTGSPPQARRTTNSSSRAP